LFTRFKSSSTILFLDSINTHTLEYDKSKKLSIILSPSLYWVQKLSLPVKYVREVTKLLPSIFEERLPEGDYSYFAYKSGDDFFVFAYEDKKILKLLHDKGINSADIKSLHFAQSEFSDLDTPLEINETQSLYLKDELLVVMPSSWLKETKDMDLNDVILSKHKIKLQQYGHIVKNSSLYKIAIILSALILIVFVEGFITSQKSDSIDEAKNELFSKYKLKPTMFQNKSMLKKYKNIYTKQSKLREYMSYFLSMRLPKTQKITLIDYNNNILNVKISGIKQGGEQIVLNKLNSKKVKFKSSFKGNIFRVEIKI